MKTAIQCPHCERAKVEVAPETPERIVTIRGLGYKLTVD